MLYSPSTLAGEGGVRGNKLSSTINTKSALTDKVNLTLNKLQTKKKLFYVYVKLLCYKTPTKLKFLKI
jgi:hypothetical protein